MSASTLRNLVQVGIGGLVLTAAVVWLSGGCGARIAPDEGPPLGRDWSGETTAVERRSIEEAEWASGTVASARHAAVSSRVLATIREVRVRAGSEVRAGDVLIVLDAAELEARTAAASEALRAARARLTLAEQEMARAEELLAEGVGTRKRVDEAGAALRVARAEVDRLEQGEEEASATAGYLQIRAPVSGRVVDRLAEPGDTAVPGRPLLRIYDPSVLRVEVPVRESLAVGLRLGQGIPIRIDALGSSLEGVVDEIVPFADSGARTLLVKVRLPADERVIAGMYARVAVPAGTRERLLIPAGAVRRVGQLESVVVVTADGRAERRMVTLGRPRPGEARVEVLSGLAEGERIGLPGV